MKRCWWLGVFLVAHVAAPSRASAEVPAGLVYEGTLETADGQPVSSTVSATFELHNAPVGGQLQFTQTIPALPVTAGHFTAVLESPAGTPSLAELFGGVPLWLAVTINGDTLAPRTSIHSVPYALHAGAVAWGNIQSVPEDLLDGDADTTYGAGAGLLLNDTTFSVDAAWVEARARAVSLDSAAEAQAALASVFLALSGGSLSGPLNLAGSPTADTHAANKGYVDSRACTWGAPSGWTGCTAPTPNCAIPTTSGVEWQTATLSCGGTSRPVVINVRGCSRSDSPNCN